MDSLHQSAFTPNKTKLSRTFAKVLHIRSAKVKHETPITDSGQPKFFNENEEDDKFQRLVMEAFIAKIFATISSVKAAYAQLQYAQTPYDADGIQSADQIVVSELKNLSELKQAFLKKHLDDRSPETTVTLAEICEQKNLLQMYEITCKKLDSQRKLKDSEIIFLKEKLNEANRENKSIERRLNSSGPLSHLSNLSRHCSSLTPNEFHSALRQTTKSIRSFVKSMVEEMEVADWDIDAAVNAIHPGIVYTDANHKCYAFESFVCRVMFDGFNHKSFSVSGDFTSPISNDFNELKSLKPRDYINQKPKSMFAKFCLSKYLRLIHPVMEFSLFGNLNQRNLVAAGKFPETSFFTSFADVAKRVWLLHCFAFASDSVDVSVFQVRKGSRFTEVFMASVNEEPLKASPEVAFTVVPGFKVGKTVVQCQVYLT